MTTLFFEPDITGHRQEYIDHLIDYIVDNKIPGDFIFIVHPDFKVRASYSASQQIKIEALSSPRKRFILSSPRKRGPRDASLCPANTLRRNLQTFRLADRLAKEYGAGHLCFLNFNDVQLALGFYRPEYMVSGILFKPFARLVKDTFRLWLTWQRKYFQTWLFVRNSRIKSMFVLNDDKSVEYLNRTYHTGMFRLLPDPVPELTPEPGLDIRKQFGISKDRKLFLHIGSLLKRKGTLDILDAFLFLSPDETARFALLIVGKASPEMDTLIRSKIEMLNNLQPATCNLQPATCIRYLNEFLSPEVFKSCIDQSDLVLVPYRYAESSSGVAGHAFAAGKPLLGVRKGLLGEMVAEYGSGIFIDEYGPASIAKGIKRALTAELTGKTSLRFLQMHSKEAFAAKIIASIPR